MSKYGEGSKWYFEDGWYTVRELAEKKGIPHPTMRSRIWKHDRGSKVLAAHVAMCIQVQNRKRRRSKGKVNASLVKRLNEMWRR